MKKYEVALPFAGYFTMVVEAESESQAIEEAMSVDIALEMRALSNESCEVDLGEWETFKNLIKGNVFYGHTSHAEAYEMVVEDVEETE